MKKRITTLLLVFVLFLTLTACNGTDNSDKNTIYVTVYPMQYLVEEIAGDTVEVKRVPGVSSHGESINWSAKEIIDMVDADLLFYVNAGADNYIQNNMETFEDGEVQLVDISQHVTYNQVCFEHHHDEDEEHHDDEAHMEDCSDNALSDDPHFWLDPVRMLQAAEFVKDKLIATFPDNQELYNNKYTVLKAALEKLDHDYQEMADEATKPIMTTVMLFTYFHDRYDIEILSITNDAHSSENNPGEIIEFVNHAIEDGIVYILFEKNANSPAGDQVLTELQGTVPSASKLYLHGLGNISMEEHDNGSNYITIMYENLETLKLSTK